MSHSIEHLLVMRIPGLLAKHRLPSVATMICK